MEIEEETIMSQTAVKLDLESVQVREQRLGAITAWQGGSASKLLEEVKCGCLKDRDRKFSQCYGCSTTHGACQTIMIEDAAVISHGPVGCSSCFHGFAFGYRVSAHVRDVKEIKQRHVFSTNLEEKDTIYGGGNKLRETIREAYNRVHPNAIFVLTTCSAGIIGDDIEAITNEMEKEIGIPVAAVYCEGFRSRVWTTGFDASYHAIARKLIKPPKEKRKMINVINFWGEDIFNDWFKPLGYEANYIAPYATVESLGHASEAVATMQVCPTLGTYFAHALESEFGVPEIKEAPPYGIVQTDAWFRNLGQLLGKEKEVEELIAKKKEEYLPQIEEIRSKLKGKTVYVAAGAAYGHNLLAIARELGMETVGAGVYHHEQKYDNGSEDSDILRKVVDHYGDIPNFSVCNKQEYELINRLHQLQPDFLLARHPGTSLCAAKQGIPSLLIDDEHFAMGYEGIVKMGKRILYAIENDEFLINLKKHTVTAYTKWWLDQSPDTFLK